MKFNYKSFNFIKGGWGWVVVVASTIIYGSGMSSWSNFFLFYPEFIEYYNATEKDNVAYSGIFNLKKN